MANIAAVYDSWKKRKSKGNGGRYSEKRCPRSSRTLREDPFEGLCNPSRSMAFPSMGTQLPILLFPRFPQPPLDASARPTRSELRAKLQRRRDSHNGRLSPGFPCNVACYRAHCNVTTHGEQATMHTFPRLNPRQTGRGAQRLPERENAAA